MDVDAGVLARPARPGHRPHRLQGQLAVALAGVDGRRGDRASPTPCRPTRRCSSWRGVGARRARRARRRARLRRAGARRRRGAARGRPAPRRAADRARAPSPSPRETYEVNVMGTVNVLEAVRADDGVRAVVNVTSDKCYENREWEWAYREDEPMGGHDPYSQLQGRVGARHERLAAVVLRRADGPRLASARAGNVIGGGDWGAGPADPRRHARGGRRRAGRDPQPGRDAAVAARAQPAQRLSGAGPGAVRGPERAATAWNFGPAEGEARPVSWIVERLDALWPGGLRWEHDAGRAPARGALPEGRLQPRPRAPRLGADAGASSARWTRSSSGTRRCATAPTCAPSRSAQIEAFTTRAIP